MSMATWRVAGGLPGLLTKVLHVASPAWQLRAVRLLTCLAPPRTSTRTARRELTAFSDPASGVRQRHFHCSLLVTAVTGSALSPDPRGGDRGPTFQREEGQRICRHVSNPPQSSAHLLDGRMDGWMPNCSPLILPHKYLLLSFPPPSPGPP